MSDTLKNIISKLYDYDIKVFSGEGCSAQRIMQSEKVMGSKFPEEYIEFLSTYGSLSFSSYEIFGRFNEEINEIPDAVWYSIENRKYGLDERYLLLSAHEIWAPAFDLSDESPGTVYYLSMNTSPLGLYKEICSNSFNEYIDQLVSKAISEV